MNSLNFCFSSFLVSFVAQILLWRFRRPGRQRVVITLLFGGVFVGGLLISTRTWRMIRGGAEDITFWADLFQMTLCYAALVCAYITTYSAVEVDSPSLTMIRMIADAGKQGISRDDFLARIRQYSFLDPRIDDLLREGLIASAQDRLVITGTGRRFVAFFVFLRRVLNTGKGG
jgi:hypothetical protein